MAEEAYKGDPSTDQDMVELRQEFTYAQDEKREIREEGAIDMRYISGDCWEPEDRAAREEASRPVVAPDELNQYVNQLVNGVRQNKRSIKVAPRLTNTNPKTAEFRQNKVRQIEYESNAQQAYAVMFENTAQRSYGYLRVLPERDVRSFDWELRIKGIPNPDLVTEDPADGRTDGSDWKFLWYREAWTRAAFKRKFPRAKMADFAEIAKITGASSWVNASTIHVAERWFIDPKPRTLLQVQPAPNPAQPNVFPLPFTRFKDELQKKPLRPGERVLRDREVDYPYVKKQITNGLEILEEVDFPGTSIPFVSCYGKVLFLDGSDGAAKKVILSLIRLGRSPQMLYAYYRTQQAEMAGMVPKVPVNGYKGQFAGMENDWQKAPHEPLAFIESNFTTEGWNPQWGPMPLPQRIAYSAGEHLQALELCAEGARRAIQAAMGISPLPTSAQRRNEKSGVALQTMQDSEQRGSFHFVDHFDDALLRTGTILCDLMPHYYDTARDTTIRDNEDQPAQVRINDPQAEEPIMVSDGDPGDHDVTLSVGPREASEREAASNFADTLIASPLMRFIPPPLALKLTGMAVRLKAVGPIGDQIAELLSPKEGEAQGPTPQQVEQMQAQIQELTAKLQQAAQALETDQAKEQARVEIEKIKADVQIQLRQMQDSIVLQKAAMDNETKLRVEEMGLRGIAMQAEIDAAEAQLNARIDGEAQARGQQHEQGMAAMTAEQQAAQAEQGHARQLEAGEIEAQRAAEQAAAEATAQGGV